MSTKVLLINGSPVHEDIRAALISMAEPEYRSFHCSLIPTVSPELVLGVRIPKLRKYARSLNAEEAALFLASLPHHYYEEYMLHGLLLSAEHDYDETLVLLADFLPYVDNWAVCDSLRPVAFKKQRQRLIEDIKAWLCSDHCYTLRFGLEMLMTHYLDEDFDPAHLELAAAVQSEEYYVNMMVAWYFATALAKQYDSAIKYIEQRRLSPWVHNKSIQKALESYRVSPEHKAVLKSMKTGRDKL